MMIGLSALGDELWQAHVSALPASLRRTGTVHANEGEWEALAMDIVEFGLPHGLFSASELATIRTVVDAGGFGETTEYFHALLSDYPHPAHEG